MYKLLFIISALLFSIMTVAQDSGAKPPPGSAPIPVEVFFGNNRFVSQITMTKQIPGSNRFGLIAYSYIAASYDNDLSENESMNVMFLSYEIYKGFGLISGAALNSYWGFRPFAGAKYFYANKTFLAMLSSGFYLTESNNFETRAVVQYRPHLKGNWALYTRVEGLYNEDMDTKKHDRSYIYARLGLNYKTVSFGFATDFDWYGPSKVSRENYGVFISVAFK
jgi:hypothetical protein